MGKYKSVMLLGVAVIIALMTSLLIYGYLQKKGRVKEGALETQPIVVAAVDLSWGTRITNEMLKQASFLKGSLTTGYFSDPALVVGRVLIYPVKVNEPIFESRRSGSLLDTWRLTRPPLRSRSVGSPGGAKRFVRVQVDSRHRQSRNIPLAIRQAGY